MSFLRHLSKDVVIVRVVFDMSVIRHCTSSTWEVVLFVMQSEIVNIRFV